MTTPPPSDDPPTVPKWYDQRVPLRITAAGYEQVEFASGKRKLLTPQSLVWKNPFGKRRKPLTDNQK